MPQAKNPEQTPNKGRNPRVSKGVKQPEEQPKCHVHDKVSIFDDVDDIRENICVNDEPLTEFEGKHYCLFHLPSKDKDIKKFEEKFRARLKATEEKLAAIEELPEEEQENAKNRISYDFRYVWFPLDVDLNNYKFSANASFSGATFSAVAYFSLATFSADASFRSATFSAVTYFRSATFSAVAYFISATFSAHADFRSATFSVDADFRSATFSAITSFNEATFSAITSFNEATFSADASFRSATFSAVADFRWATFSALTKFDSATFSDFANFNTATFSAKVYFIQTKFTEIGITEFTEANFDKDVFFDETEFRNEVHFNAVIFGKESDVFFRDTFFAKKVNFQYCTAEGYLRFSNLRGNDYQFDFQEAAFEKATRVSFHTAQLCPNWFVNVDSRKFVFTDVEWRNLTYKRRNKNIWDELEILEQREIKEQNKRLLEIAARQLAVNAEENNRYEEAAGFRYMAMEIKRLEERKHFRFSRYLTWLYKWTSGYGESWSWAAFVLVFILFFFGVFYNSPFANFEMPEKKQPNAVIEKSNEEKPSEFYKMNNLEGFVHSLYVAALQRPEPKAADTTTRLFIILETIFAPLQAALLALAIRRKFMR